MLIKLAQIKFSVGAPQIAWNLVWLISHLSWYGHFDLIDNFVIELATYRSFEVLELAVVRRVIQDEDEGFNVVCTIIVRSTSILVRQVFYCA